MKRILVYSATVRGASDIERLLGAAVGAQGSLTGASVLVVADTPAGSGFRLASRMYRVHLPPAPGGSGGDGAQDACAIRTELMMNAVREFSPDAIVIDGAIGPAQAELERTLTYVREHLPRTSRVLVVGGAETVASAPVSAMDAAAEGLYDRVLTWQ
jgi:predicted glycosyltransferase